jgi:hypothetical protein
MNDISADGTAMTMECGCLLTYAPIGIIAYPCDDGRGCRNLTLVALMSAVVDAPFYLYSDLDLRVPTE